MTEGGVPAWQYRNHTNILFDTIKSNLYKGNIINEGLWATLSNIIPFYQQNYGIDGARIDMGHALPSELIHRIIANARTNDPDFCFIAEELQDENAKVSRDNGYNMIIGYGFFQEPRTYEHRTHKFMYDSRHLPCPVFAGGETHDTPRLAARETLSDNTEIRLPLRRCYMYVSTERTRTPVEGQRGGRAIEDLMCSVTCFSPCPKVTRHHSKSDQAHQSY